jgi:hypothetical protein
MKKTLLILTIILTFQIGYTQGTLQFNSVINETLVSTGSRNSSTGSLAEFATFTVPENKIWKVTYMVANFGYLDNNGFSSLYSYDIAHKAPNKTNLFNLWEYDFVAGGINHVFYFSSGTHSLYARSWGNTQGPIIFSFNGIEYNILN